MNQKLAFVEQLKLKKSIIEGKFSDKITQENKNAAWEELLVFAKSIGLVPESYTKEKLRDQTWANWKRRAKDKFDKRRRTGTGKVKMTDLDNAVLDVIGKDSPRLIGLNISEDETEQVNEEVQNQIVEPKTTSMIEANVDSVEKDKKSKKRICNSSMLEENHAKREAQIRYFHASTDLILMQKYKTELECRLLEKQLELPFSKITSHLEQ